jgi:hypothetical protein
MLSDAALKDPAMSGQLDYDRIEGDFYPTPPENVDCLAHFVPLFERIVWEPACGEGHISKRLAAIAKGVFSTDLYGRGYGTTGLDFLGAGRLPGNADKMADCIITNPPFGDLAEQFIRKALELTAPVDGLVAMFLRNEYDMASTGRNDLFEGHPAYGAKICVTKRPRWIEGSKGSPRHSYAWYVWDWQLARTRAASGAVIRYIHPKQARPLVASSSIH